MPEDAVRTAVLESFTRQSLMATIGAKLGLVVAGEVEIELPFTDGFGQQSGLVHAGIIAAIADSACGGAALTTMPPGSDVVSVEFKLNLLGPARGERFIARARVLRAGRTLTVCSADVMAIADGSETLIATMLGTMMRR